MICIVEIKTVDIDRDTFEIFHMNLTDPWATVIGNEDERVPITREMICGERFNNVNGQTVCIGMAKNVQEAIGLPFEAFRNMSKELGEMCRTVKDIRDAHVLLESQYQKHKIQIEKFCKAVVWKRLKYLFCGWRDSFYD